MFRRNEIFYNGMKGQTALHNHYQRFTKPEQKNQSQETIQSIFAKILFVLGKISKQILGAISPSQSY